MEEPMAATNGETSQDTPGFKTTYNSDGSTVRRSPALGLTEIRYPGGTSYMRVRADALGLVQEFWHNGRHFYKLTDGTWIDEQTKRTLNKAIVVIAPDGTIKIFQASGLEIRKPSGEITFYASR